MIKIIFYSLFFVLASCTATPTTVTTVTTSEDLEKEVLTNETTLQKASSCICVKMWIPVCGKNKKTYGNACEADCAGVKFTNGACAELK